MMAKEASESLHCAQAQIEARVSVSSAVDPALKSHSQLVPNHKRKHEQ